MATIHPSIDFRPGTVTWPTPAMVEAIAMAKLGDDVYGEDPTSPPIALHPTPGYT